MLCILIAGQLGSTQTRSDKFRRIGDCLYRYGEMGFYYAFVRQDGKLIKRSLWTKNLVEAKRYLRDFRNKI